MGITKRRWTMHLRNIITAVFAIAFCASIFSTLKTSAEANVFTIENVELTELSENAEGGITSFNGLEVRSNVTFHKVGDTAKYTLTIKNTSEEDLTINYISDNDDNDYLSYQYDNFENTLIKSNESFDFIVTVKYENAVADLNKRTQLSNVKFIINYNGGQDIIPLVPDTSGNTTKAISDAIKTNIIAIIISTIGLIVSIVLTIKRHKKCPTIVAGLVIAISAIATTTSVKAATIEINTLSFISTYNLADKLAITYTIDGNEETETIDYGSKFTKEVPAKDNYNTIGWVLEDGSSFDPETAITNDLKLTAKYEFSAIIVNFMGNGLNFANNSTKNTVAIGNSCHEEPVPQAISHTANIRDDGTVIEDFLPDDFEVPEGLPEEYIEDYIRESIGRYPSNLSTLEAYKLEGASSLKITLTYGIETDYDNLYIVEGYFPNGPDENTVITQDQVHIFTGGEWDEEADEEITSTAEIIIPGNSVTFNFESDESVGYYGYYAKITPLDENGDEIPSDETVTVCGKNIVSGEYLEPEHSDRQEFFGWSENPSKEDLEYSNESEVINNLQGEIGETKTLYAVWLNKHDIIYNSNGGEGDPYTITAYGGSRIVLSPADDLNFYRENYDFLGWSEDKNATTPTYSEFNLNHAFEVPDNTGTTTLYAVWKKQHRLIYDGNGADSGTMDDVYLSAGSTTRIKDSEYTREDHIFLGWSEDKNATSADYATDDIFTAPESAETTLYAVWKEREYLTINMHSNGLKFDDESEVNTLQYSSEYRSINITDASKISKTRNIDNSGNASSNYSNNQATTDTISFEGASYLNVTITYGTEYGSDGVYIFAGRYTGSVQRGLTGYHSFFTGGGSTQTTKTAIVEGDTVTFAFYSDRSYAYYGYYAVVEPLDGAKNILTPGEHIVYTRDLVKGTYKEPSLAENQAFSGWSESADATYPEYYDEDEIRQALAGNEGDTKDLYAIWYKLHTIKFDGNGATSGSMSNLTVDGGTTATLTANAFSRTGYDFVGWSTDKNATEPEYTNTFTAPNDYGTTTLYAVWRSYTVHFDSNGADSGITTLSDLAASITKTVRLPEVEFDRHKYKFIGWSTDKNAEEAEWGDQEYFKYPDDGTTEMTLYAVWVPTYTIIYDGNGATGGSMDGFVTKIAKNGEFEPLIASNFNRDGYGFIGWSLDTDAGERANDTTNKPKIYGPNEVVFLDKTLTDAANEDLEITMHAVWVPKETEYTFQNFDKTAFASANPTKKVIALEDERDGDVYAVIKQADNNWWMVENLRLNPADRNTTINASNTNNPTNTFLTAVNNIKGKTGTLTKMCDKEGASSCLDALSFDTHDITRSNPAHPSKEFMLYNPGSNLPAMGYSWYSYGVHYGYYTATAGNGLYGANSGDNAAGDLCPKGWHLPLGGSSSSEFIILDNIMFTGSLAATSYGSRDLTDANIKAMWSNYPTNAVRSGDTGYIKPAVGRPYYYQSNRSTFAMTWTRTASTSVTSLNFGEGFRKDYIKYGSYGSVRLGNDGGNSNNRPRPMRCIAM